MNTQNFITANIFFYWSLKEHSHKCQRNRLNNNAETKQQISVDKLSNGVYLLEVKTIDKIYTAKVSIAH